MDELKTSKNWQSICKVDKVILTESIEIFDCTEQAKNSIEEIFLWRK